MATMQNPMANLDFGKAIQNAVATAQASTAKATADVERRIAAEYRKTPALAKAAAWGRTGLGSSAKTLGFAVDAADPVGNAKNSGKAWSSAKAVFQNPVSETNEKVNDEYWRTMTPKTDLEAKIKADWIKRHPRKPIVIEKKARR